jgi:hypothetical protein
MPSKDVLADAVSKGIIAPEQADALSELENQPAQHPELARKTELDAEDDEGFRFISGFNDIFLAFGVVMVLYGISLSQLDAGLVGHAVTALTLWGLGEVFAGWLKRTLPSMIVAAAFVYHMLSISSIYLYGSELPDFDVFSQGSSFDIFLPLCAAGIIFALIFYARFRLPFALFLTGVQVILVVILYATNSLDQDSISYIIPMLFITGILFFAMAMWFDLSDRLRQTRLSDNAFWLHLLASPLIVHSIMWQSAIWIIGYERTNSLVELESIAPTLAGVVLIIFLILMSVALIIDRRAMLVSSLIYVSVAVTYFIAQQGNLLGAASFTPILIGTAVISLGVGWRPIRQFLFTILPLGSIETSLPPLRS